MTSFLKKSIGCPNLVLENVLEYFPEAEITDVLPNGPITEFM